MNRDVITLGELPRTLAKQWTYTMHKDAVQAWRRDAIHELEQQLTTPHHKSKPGKK